MAIKKKLFKEAINNQDVINTIMKMTVYNSDLNAITVPNSVHRTYSLGFSCTNFPKGVLANQIGGSILIHYSYDGYTAHQVLLVNQSGVYYRCKSGAWREWSKLN